MSSARAYSTELTMADDAAILSLWKLKFDTLEIATRLKRPEWQVANRLLHLRGQQQSS